MFPANFEYSAPASLDEVIELLEKHGESAKLVAGGHSLIPLMKLRFAQPQHVIDLRRIDALVGIRVEPTQIVIGALTTHAQLAREPQIRSLLPILAEAAGVIGDPQVRNRGTIGGSLAHGDPGADLPAVMLALDAEIVAVGHGGRRTIPAGEFFLGLLTTALESNEVLVEVRISRPRDRSAGAYSKQPHAASRYAVVGVAAMLELDVTGQTIRRARVAITGLGVCAARAYGVEEGLTGARASAETLRAAADRAAAGVEIREDSQGDMAYKANLARVHTLRALTRALERA